MIEKLFICGASQWGKTTLAQELTRRYSHRITLDASGDWARRGERSVRSLADASAVMHRDWKKGFQFVYTPTADDAPRELHRLSLLAFAYMQERGYYRRYRRELMIVVDEMALCFSHAHSMRSDLGGFKQATLVGRHYGIALCGITQRPQDVATLYRDNADKKFAFMLHSDAGRDAAVSMIGRANAKAYDALGRFEYLAKVDGTVTRGRTKK